MKTKFKFLFLFLIGIALTSCSSRLIGTWTIQKYETTKPEQQAITLINIGTITFNKDGSGEKNVSYIVFGENYFDDLEFNWTTENQYVTIEGQGSKFSKTWIMVESTRRTQKWHSTNGGALVEVLELTKIIQPRVTTNSNSVVK